jgi:hypothetical protein
MKIWPILATFDKKDWHWCEKHIKSNQNNSDFRLVEWFLLLKKHRDKWLKNTEKSDFFLELSFLKPNDSSKKNHHLNNYMLRVVEGYLAWQQWHSDDLATLQALLQACGRRHLDKHFAEVLQRIEQQRAQQPFRDARYHRIAYEITVERYQQSMYSGRSEADLLQSLSDHHDVAFVAEKLKNACGQLSRRKVLKSELDTGLLPAALQFVQQRPELLHIPAISIYYYGYFTLVEPDNEAHFFQLKLLLNQHRTLFHLQELHAIYLLAINFCIHRINLRQSAYLRELLTLYQQGLEARVFFENGQLSRFTYTNIALLALRMREYAWGQHFLEQYKPALPESHRTGTYALNMARYCCELSDYDRAITLLQEMDSDDTLHTLMAKAMLLRMYYDTGAINALQSLLDSFSVYLRRKQRLGEQQQLAYKNLIRLLRKLTRLRPNAHTARAALRLEVEQTTLLAEKEWLLSRL